MDPEVTSGGTKRRLSEDDEDLNGDEGPQRKKIPREEVFEFGLLCFSDEILMHIMGYLDTAALIQLSRTCCKLQDLTADKTLWSDVDLSYEPMTGEEIRKIIFKDVCRYTEIRSLTLRGLVGLHPVDKWKNQTVTSTFLAQLSMRCPHLRSITIYEACLDISRVTILSFPTMLRQFNVNRCEIICSEKRTNRRDISFFSGINSHLKDLERLYVENCNWFDTHDLIAFSKLPTLKELSLRGCNSFKECVPYGSIATRFGFRTLEVLDVRNTPVTDSDIQCFNMTKSLKELRLQCPEPAKERTEEGARTSEAAAGGTNSAAAGSSSGESSTTASASNSPTATPQQQQQQPATPAPAAAPQPAAAHPPIERQVINLHLRRLGRAGRQNEAAEQVAAGIPMAGNAGNNMPEIVREDADGAVIQAGNNNLRINIRNQNVQGRHVIHIAIRNSHNCGRNQDNNAEAGPNNNQPGGAAAEPNANAARNNRDANERADNAEANNNDQANGNGRQANENDNEQGE